VAARAQIQTLAESEQRWRQQFQELRQKYLRLVCTCTPVAWRTRVADAEGAPLAALSMRARAPQYQSYERKSAQWREYIAVYNAKKAQRAAAAAAVRNGSQRPREAGAAAGTPASLTTAVSASRPVLSPRTSNAARPAASASPKSAGSSRTVHPAASQPWMATGTAVPAASTPATTAATGAPQAAVVAAPAPTEDVNCDAAVAADHENKDAEAAERLHESPPKRVKLVDATMVADRPVVSRQEPAEPVRPASPEGPASQVSAGAPDVSPAAPAPGPAATAPLAGTTSLTLPDPAMLSNRTPHKSDEGDAEVPEDAPAGSPHAPVTPAAAVQTALAAIETVTSAMQARRAGATADVVRRTADRARLAAFDCEECRQVRAARPAPTGGRQRCG